MSDEMVPVRYCEDCVETVVKGERRQRCKHCDRLVCGWCYHHVHGVFVLNAPAPDARPPGREGP